MALVHRRDFLRSSVALAAAGASTQFSNRSACQAEPDERERDAEIRFGLVTYMWGFDWDLPTLLKNCETAQVYGVELRTEHAHRVEPSIDAAARSEVKQRFADSPITLIGLGCNEAFHDPDPQIVQASIERAKAFIKLSHDVGGSGVKVKPNDLPAGVPHEKTTAQIGRALNELGVYAAELDQDVRLEVHGQCAPLPIIAAIMQVVDHPRVGVCWNSNGTDLQDKGLEYNFRLVQNRLGKTTHVHAFDDKNYPYAKLMELYKGIDYHGWWLFEAGDKPADRVTALATQRQLFEQLVKG